MDEADADELDEPLPDPGWETELDGAGRVEDVGCGAGDVGCEVVPEPTPRGLPGSTGGSFGCPGRPPGSGEVGSTGTVIPTAPLAYTRSTPMTSVT